MALQCSDARQVRFFVGDGTNGAWAITMNAAWNPESGGQLWAPDNIALASAALFCIGETIHVLGKASGSATWTNWDTTRGQLAVGSNAAIGGALDVAGVVSATDLDVVDDATIGSDLTVTGTATAGTFTTAGTVNAADVAASDDITAGGDLTVTGNATIGGSLDVAGNIECDDLNADDANVTDDLEVGGTITVAGEVVYQTPPTRRLQIPIAAALTDGFVANLGEYLVLAPGEVANIPINVPTGSVLGQVRVLFDPQGASDFDITIQRKHGGSMSTTLPSLPTTTPVDAALGITSAAVQSNGDCSFGGLTTVSGETYWVSLLVDASASNPVWVYAVDVEFTDPGPRNF